MRQLVDPDPRLASPLGSFDVTAAIECLTPEAAVSQQNPATHHGLQISYSGCFGPGSFGCHFPSRPGTQSIPAHFRTWCDTFVTSGTGQPGDPT